MEIIKNLSRKKIIILAIAIFLLIVLIIKFLPNSNRKTEYDQNNQSAQKPAVINIQPNVNLNIATGGPSRLFGVKINSIDGNIINTWGILNGTATTFIIKTNRDTKYFNGNTQSSLKNFAPGNILMVSGKVEEFSPEITFLASEIKAYGIVPKNAPTNTTPKATTTSTIKK